MADDADSPPKNPSEMTLGKYVTFTRLYQKLITIEDRDLQMEKLAEMIEAVWSDDADMQLEASSQFRNILHIKPNPPLQQVIEAGVVPRFVQFLNREDFPQLQCEAIRILIVFAETSEHMKVVVDHGAIPEIVKLLHAPSKITRELAIMALGRTAKESPELREFVLQNRALEPFLAQFKEDNNYFMMPKAAWALLQFCQNNPPLSSEMTSQVLFVIQRLLHSSNQRVVAEACAKLYYLTRGTTGKIQAAIESGVCSKLVEMLHHNSASVVIPAIETVANIVSGDEMQAQCIIDLGALPKIMRLLSYNNIIKKAVCRAVSNITKGNINQIQAVVDHGLIYALVHLFEHSEVVEIKNEVALAISNVTSNGTREDIKRVSEACITPLCDMLGCSDPVLISICLKSLESILNISKEEMESGISNNFTSYLEMIEKAKGLEKIRNLQYHEDDVVYGIARRFCICTFTGQRQGDDTERPG